MRQPLIKVLAGMGIGFLFMAGMSVPVKAAGTMVVLSTASYDRGIANDEAGGVTIDGSGNILVTGYAKNNSTNRNDVLTIKYTPNLMVISSAVFHCEDDAWGSDVVVDASSNIIVTGHKYTLANGSIDWLIIKYDPNFVMISSAMYHNGNWESTRAVALDNAGNIIVTGSRGNGADFYTVKYSPTLQVLFSAAYNTGNPLNGGAHDVAVDASGNIIVTGYKGQYTGNPCTYLTIKYNPSLVMLSSAVYDGGNMWAQAGGVAVDGSGNIYVTGVSYNSSSKRDFHTIKYNSNLAVLASADQPTGSASWSGNLNKIALDGQGNVIVAGTSYVGSRADFSVFKYNSNLVPIASAVYNGGPTVSEPVNGITVDGTGNVYLTGSNFNGSNTDFFTVKYSSYLIPPPDAPDNLAVSSISAHSISLTWQAPVDAVRFRVMKSTNNAAFTLVSSATVVPSCTVNGLAPETTYYFAVSAYNIYGEISLTSATVSGVTIPATLPGTPTSLTVGDITTHKLSLSWQAPVDAVRFRLLKSTDNATFSLVTSTITSLAYVFNGLAPATTYYFAVYSCNVYDDISSASGTVSGATLVLTSPPPPDSLAAVPITTRKMALTWPAAAGAVRYQVMQSTDNTTFSMVTSTLTVSTCTVSGLTPATTYYFAVYSYNSYDDISLTSATVSRATLMSTPVIAPSDVNAIDSTWNSVTLTWSPSPGSVRYNVMRTEDGDTYTEVGSDLSGPPYTVNGLAPESFYMFTVYAYNDYDDISPMSDLGFGVTQTAPPLTNPTDLTVSTRTTHSIMLTWQPPEAAIRYQVMKSTDNSTWTEVTSTTTVPNYTVDGLTPDLQCYFRVYAYNYYDESSEPSETVITTTLPVPPALADITISARTAGSITLNWQATSNAVRFQVLRSTDNAIFSVVTSTLTVSTTTISGLVPATTYYFGVYAYNAYDEVSLTSATISGVTLPLPVAPATINVSSSTAHTTTLTWQDTGAARYKVMKSTDNATFSIVTSTTTAATYAVGGLNSATTYYFAIYSYNAYDEVSLTSATVSGVTLPLPVAPTPLVIGDRTAYNIALTWQDTGAARYQLLKSTDNVTFSIVTSTTTAATYAVGSLNPATTYYFAVNAYDTNDDVSLTSATVSGVTLPLPLAPSPLVIGTRTAYNIQLTWQNTGAARYQILKSTDNATFSVLSSTITDFTLTAGGLAPATTYYFAVNAYDTNDDVSLTSATVSCVTLPLPIAPTPLVICTRTAYNIQLTWQNTGAARYQILKSTDNATFSVLSSTITGFALSAGSLDPATTYYFAVNAYDTNDDVSLTSATVSAVTLPLPLAPATIDVSSGTAHSTILTWQDTGAARYQLLKSTDNVTFSIVSSTLTVATYADGSLNPATTYYFAVYAYDTNDDVSLTSATVSGVTLPLPVAPTPLVIGARTAYNIALTWQNTGAARYQVMKSTDNATFSVLSSTITGFTLTAGSLNPATTYYFAVNAYDTNDDVSLTSATVSGVTLPLPLAPTPLVIGTRTAYNIQLTWQNTGAARYQILKSTDNATFSIFSSTITGTSLSIDSLNPATTYYFAVRAYDANDDVSLSSATVSGVTLPLPVAPATMDVSTGTAHSTTLTWQDTGAARYQILKSTDNVTFSIVTSTTTAATYAIGGLTPATTYYFAIFSYNAYDEVSLTSSTITVVTLPVPLAPTELIVNARTASSITLNWQATGATRFKVMQSTDNATFSVLTTTAAVPSYAVNGLSPATTYYFAVYSYDSSNEISVASATVSGVTLPLPIAPATLDISTGTAHGVTLTWQDTGAARYQLLKSTDNVTFSIVTSTLTAATYAVGGLNPATTYYFAIYSYNVYDEVSLTSSTITVVTLPALTAAPTNITISTRTARSIMLTWQDSGAARFKVIQSTDNAVFTVLTTTTTALTYAVNSLTPAATYYFGVYSYSVYDDISLTSATVSGITLPLPVAPASIAASTSTVHSITLNWQSSGDATRFRVLRSTDNATFELVSDTISVTACSVGGLLPATTYYFRVYSYNSFDDISSTYVSIVAVTPMTRNPVTDLSSGSITVTEPGLAGGTVSEVHVEIPQGTVAGEVYLDINHDPVNNPKEADKTKIAAANIDVGNNGVKLSLAGAETEFNLYYSTGGRCTTPFGHDVLIELSYIDNDNDGKVDGTTPPVLVDTLQLYVLNEATGRWDIVPSTLDKANKKVAALLRHFSVYTLIGQRAAASDLGGIRVYPNPYRPGSGGSFDRAAGIVFTGLTAHAEIRIYTIAGELVYEGIEDNGDGEFDWLAVNSSGNKLASGVYIALIKNGGEKKRIKIAIER